MVQKIVPKTMIKPGKRLIIHTVHLHLDTLTLQQVIHPFFQFF